MRRASFLAAVMVLAGAWSAPAHATWWWWHSPECDPDSVGSGTVEISDSITGAFWTFGVNYEVFGADNCANPHPVSGSFTYVYTVSLTDQGPVPVSLESLRVRIDDVSYVLESGVITGGPGVAPTQVSVVGSPVSSVTATFDPGSLTLGTMSLPIFVVSPYRPGTGTIDVDVTLFSGSGPALVPKELPEACPCTISFWKLRALNWLWYLGYFPGQQFADIKARAVQLSEGYFANEAALMNALFYSGFLSIRRKAESQLAGVLLNVAAGQLFPGNTRCRLFPGTPIDLNDDGVGDQAVEEAITAIIADIQSGDWHLQYEAFALAEDINEGRNVIGAVSFQ